MAEVERYECEEEFFALFVRVDGKRGTVLVFVQDDNPDAAVKLGEDIAKIIDQ